MSCFQRTTTQQNPDHSHSFILNWRSLQWNAVNECVIIHYMPITMEMSVYYTYSHTYIYASINNLSCTRRRLKRLWWQWQRHMRQSKWKRMLKWNTEQGDMEIKNKKKTALVSITYKSQRISSVHFLYLIPSSMTAMHSLRRLAFWCSANWKIHVHKKWWKIHLIFIWISVCASTVNRWCSRWDYVFCTCSV